MDPNAPSLEALATPGWKRPQVQVNDWVRVLQELGADANLKRDKDDLLWIVIPSLQVQGYVSLEGTNIEAINFEFHADNPATAVEIITNATAHLGWELDFDSDPDDDN